jgi:hypothetical protein
MGFIDSPLQRHTVLASTPVRTVARTLVQNRHVLDSFRSCRSSRLQRFSPQGSSFRRTRTSTARRSIAPCSRSGGSPRFQLLCNLSIAGEPSPIHVRSLSLWQIPFEAFPSPVAVPLVTASFLRRLALLSKSSAFTDQCASLAVWIAHRPPCCHGRRACPRPQGFLPPESPLRVCGVSVAHGSMLPWAFGSIRSVPATRFRAGDGSSPLARCGSYRRVSRRPRATKRASVLGLSGSENSRCSRRPEGRHSPVGTASNPKAAALPFPLPIHPCGRLTGSLPGSRFRPEGRTASASPRIPKDRSDAVGTPEGAPPCWSVALESARSPTIALRGPRRGARATPLLDPAKGRPRLVRVPAATAPRLPKVARSR